MSVSDKYRKMDHREHVLARPSMYIGSVDADMTDTWVWDSEEERIVKRNINYVPGLYKIFDEILVNAVDHVTRMAQQQSGRPVKNIKVTIEKDTGYIEVWNDGDGIDVVLHPEHNVFVPELIFGHMLTGTNYDDDAERLIGGQNGIGAKACNIFSKEFIVTTIDHARSRMYNQTFQDNMSKACDPVVSACKKVPFTSVRFLPDYQRFGMADGLTDDMYALMVKRVHDACALTDPSVTVWFNGAKIACKSFERYADLYIGGKGEKERFYERIDNGRWEVVVACSDQGFEHVSFVNGIATFKGGKHVDNVSASIVKVMCEMVDKKRKIALRPQHVKDSLMLFIKATIDSPTFDSQSKEYLTTPASKFGSRCELSERFLDKLYKSEIMARAINRVTEQTAKDAKKTDGKKSNRIRGMHKLEDANHAGTAKSKDCALILTEGESAKGLAVAGLSVVGRDKYGVFPLRGKMLNVKDAPVKKILENEEVQNMKKILGLESGKVYEDVKDLRYGRIIIMTDADVDGSHCKGLIMNMFHSLWPSLVKQPNFVTSLLTPIIKATKGQEPPISFYTLNEFEEWKLVNQDGKGYTIKYYKGLGTSTEEEAKQYFQDMRLAKYNFNEDCNDAMNLAFNKKRTDDRKRWLGQYEPSDTIDVTDSSDVTYTDFIHRDLIHFSVYDVRRSIPSVVDGLKPSQRKILYSCFKRNLTSEIKVAQLAGYVSENAAYHHGEASLQGAIIGMAQDFVGSNNMNLLRPNGMFGSRRLGGKDAASPRYIFTQLEPVTSKMFRKEDSPMLHYLDDDGLKVEPNHYVPVLPLVLINGACGIGTGFSTNVPCYRPKDVADAIRAMINAEDAETACTDIKPWYRGFTGTIEPNGTKGYLTHGACIMTPDFKTVEITELPIGTWSEDYKVFLEELMEQNPKLLKDYETHYTNNIVRFVLHCHPEESRKLLESGDLERELKLVGSCLTTTNMHLFDERGVIKKYGSVQEILTDFYKARIACYENRKQSESNRIQASIDKLVVKARFIDDVCDGTIVIMNSTKSEIEARLAELDYDIASFGTLINTPMVHLTREKRAELLGEVNEMKMKLQQYQSIPVKDMWLREIEEVEKEYAQMEVLNQDTTSVRATKKQRKA